MKFIRIWGGKNEIGDSVDLLYNAEFDRYAMVFNERINDLVSFNEQEIGKLLHSLTDFLFEQARKNGSVDMGNGRTMKPAEEKE